jgi:hypothetical protein
MQTVFSHIIQRRFSLVNEDVATDALAFILETSEAARNGLMKLLRGIEPSLPPIRFKTQQVEGSIRPDMWGYSEGKPHIFIENKFWAGLTDNQPVSYLEQLATYSNPSILLVVAPAAREHTLWRELKRRMESAGIQFKERDYSAGEIFTAETDLGPKVALTSWNKVLSMMEVEALSDTQTKSDLVQLRSLCEASDINAFTPIQKSETSNQRTPALISQLNSVAQGVVDKLAAESVINLNNLRPQASWDRIGRYARFIYPTGHGIIFWFGLHFDLWKAYGATPLWLYFINDDYGRGQEVREIIEPWAAANGKLSANLGANFCLALGILTGEEKQAVVQNIADQIKAVALKLSDLKPKVNGNKQPIVETDSDQTENDTPP